MDKPKKIDGAFVCKEVVTGMVKMIKFMHQNSAPASGSISLHKVYDIATDNERVSQLSCTLLAEFLCRGYIGITISKNKKWKGWVDRIIAGDYTELWKEVIDEVTFLGLEPGKPVTIDV